MSDDIHVFDPKKEFGTDSTTATTATPDSLEVGTWATDKNSGEEVLILELDETPANEYVLFETPAGDSDITVANHHTNHEYSDSAPIAHTIHKSQIGKLFQGESVEDDIVLEAYNRGDINDKRVYQYPQPRLQRNK